MTASQAMASRMMVSESFKARGILANGVVTALLPDACSEIDDIHAIRGLMQYAAHLFSVHWRELDEDVRHKALEKARELEPKIRSFVETPFYFQVRCFFQKGPNYFHTVRAAKEMLRLFQIVIEKSEQDSLALKVGAFIMNSPSIKEQIEQSKRELSDGNYTDLTEEQLRKKAKRC